MRGVHRQFQGSIQCLALDEDKKWYFSEMELLLFPGVSCPVD